MQPTNSLVDLGTPAAPTKIGLAAHVAQGPRLMMLRVPLLALSLLICLPTFGEPANPHTLLDLTYASAHADGSRVDQREAFESAKELGTLEAWKAFLNAYSTGFYADLARAYVRKIGQAGATPAPKPKTKQQAQTAQTSPALETVMAEPGRQPWRVRRYELDEGNHSAMAASVSAGGVELLFYCDRRRRLAGILREGRRGTYPKFDQRIRLGLARKGGDGSPALIPMTFSDGTAYSVSASVQALTGEVSLHQDSDGTGFQTGGNLVSDLMSKSTVGIDAPPFAATLQLKNSRKALCSVIRKCGGGVARCGTSKASTKKRYKKRRTRKTKRAPTCPAGKTWNGTNCAQSPYLDNQGRPLDGYIIDQNGNIQQDNGGGE